MPYFEQFIFVDDNFETEFAEFLFADAKYQI